MFPSIPGDRDGRECVFCNEENGNALWGFDETLIIERLESRADVLLICLFGGNLTNGAKDNPSTFLAQPGFSLR